MSITDKGVAVLLGTSVDLLIPYRPLAKDALDIVSKQKKPKNFISWTEKDHQESFQMMKKVIEIWKKNNITAFLVIGVHSEGSDFRWQMVPYPNRGSPVFQQISVLWKVIFGASTLEANEQKLWAVHYEAMSGNLLNPSSVNNQQTIIVSSPSKKCCFCTEEIQKKQRVLKSKGEKASLWYDYSPLAYRHFLAVPHQHLATADSFDIQGYTSWMNMAKKVINLKPPEGKRAEKNSSTTYLVWKNEKRAGQSVPHLHLHIITIYTIFQVIMACLISLMKTLLYYPSLSVQELNKRVNIFKKELAN